MLFFMAIDQTIWNADNTFILADVPVTVTFEGSDYTGTKSTLDRQKQPEPEGESSIYRFSVHLKLDDLATEPQIWDPVTIAAVTYVILEKSIDGVDQVIRLDLGEEYADA
jgi:hypothetical protein